MMDKIRPRDFKWIILTKAELPKMKKYSSILVACESHEYPYDIIEYGKLEGKEFWHSYLHVNINKHEYSSQDLLFDFTHYFPLSHPTYGF